MHPRLCLPEIFLQLEHGSDVAQYFQYPMLLLAYQTSLRLLAQHIATLPSLSEHLVILKTLTSSLAVDAFLACLCNCSPIDAVELLEQDGASFGTSSLASIPRLTML